METDSLLSSYFKQRANFQTFTHSEKLQTHLIEKESKNLYPRYSASMTDIEIPMPKSYPSICFCQNRLIHYHSAVCQITYITDSPHWLSSA